MLAKILNFIEVFLFKFLIEKYLFEHIKINVYQMKKAVTL